MKNKIVILTKFFLKLQKIIFSKIEIKKPKKADILIWGKVKYINIFKEKNFNYLKPYKISHVEVWGESYNFRILLRCLLELDFSSLKYFNEYIRAVNPSIILSFLDNYKLFYLLRKNKNQKKILIQNAWRSNEFKTFNFKKANSSDDVDYLFCHNKNVENQYKKITRAKTIKIGSFLSNNINIKNNKRLEIVYISTFRYSKKNIFISGKISLNDYLETEQKLIRFIYKYCNEKKIKLTILPTGKKEIEEEIAFFNNTLKKNNNWKLIKRKFEDYNYPYKIIDKAKIVIGLDSTLLYEAFSRGIKTIFCDIRPKNKHLKKNRHFGWPKKFSSNGIFWTNKPEYKSIKNLIERVYGLSPNKWNSIKKKYEIELIKRDNQNKIFKKIILKNLH